MKAALERNPVSVSGSFGMEPREAYDFLVKLENESIYDGNRMAQPDEVWNFRRGNGLEKAVTLANILKNRDDNEGLRFLKENGSVILLAGENRYGFPYSGGLEPPADSDFDFKK